jgi:hypothetical protein
MLTVPNNSHYRVADLVFQRGQSFMSSALHILTDPSFVGTILYELLPHTLLLDGATLADFSSDEVAARLGGVAAPFLWSCIFPSRNASWRSCSAWSRGDRGLLTVQNDSCQTIVTLATIVQRRLSTNRSGCRSAPPNTAAVHLRLGDKAGHIFRNPVKAPGSSSQGRRSGLLPVGPRCGAACTALWGYGPSVPIHQQAAALSCTGATVVLVGVLNFSPEVLSSGLRTGQFEQRPRSVEAVTERSDLERLSQVLHRCTATSDSRGIQSTLWQGSASVDHDLCFLATAEFFVPSVGGFSELMPLLRAAIAHLDASGVRATDGAHARAAGRPTGAWCLRRRQRGLAPLVRGAAAFEAPMRAVPENGSCAFARALCAHTWAPAAWERVALPKSITKIARERDRVDRERSPAEGPIFPLHELSTLRRPNARTTP